jgi:site-specific recombinase XerD
VGLLPVDDVNLAQQRLTVRRFKRLLPGIYPLRADEVTALKAYPRERKSPSPSLFLSQRGTPISRRQLDTLMKRCGALADIPAAKRHFHVLEHSIATHLLDAGEVVVQLPQPRPGGLDVGIRGPRLVPPGHVRDGALGDDAQGT